MSCKVQVLKTSKEKSESGLLYEVKTYVSCYYAEILNTREKPEKEHFSKT